MLETSVSNHLLDFFPGATPDRVQTDITSRPALDPGLRMAPLALAPHLWLIKSLFLLLHPPQTCGFLSISGRFATLSLSWVFASLLTCSPPHGLAHSAETPHNRQNFLLKSKSDHITPLRVNLQRLRTDSQHLALNLLSDLFPLGFPSPSVSSHAS